MKRATIAAAAITLLAASPPALPASEAECAIWLCLPAGFAISGCQPAKKAFRKRLFKGKTPAPSFSSCSADGGDNGFALGRGTGALMEGNPRFVREGFPCIEADHNGDANTPRGCIDTVKITKVFQNGEQIGETYYERESFK